MLFWVVAASLTLVASLAVLLPLARRAEQEVDRSHDLEVYRDQLAEIDKDASRGVIAATDAEHARAEIARRILRLGTGNQPKTSSGSLTAAKIVGGIAVLAVPLVSWGAYTLSGSPDIPDQPLSARMAENPANSSVSDLIARAEAHLVANPSDGRGWDVLAPVYMRIGRVNDAVVAYGNAIKLLGTTATRQSGLGEAMTAAAGGIVTADARAAFDAAVQLEPANAKAHYFLGLSLAQEGKLAEAAAMWRQMVVDLPADSPWREAAEQAAARAGGPAAPSAGAGQPGPTDADIEAAASMSSGDRTAMIESMVAGLDEKLRQNPADPEGWLRLVRSYSVLGKKDLAQDAFDRGYAALGRDSDGGRKLSELAGTLGLKVTE